MTPILIILAGGASSRMWPVREKSLLRFGTEPLLINQLRRYQALGFTDAVVVGSPDNETDLRALIGDMAGLNVRIAIQREPKGMGDAVLSAAHAIPSPAGQPIYITQVHDVTDDALHSDMLAAHRANPARSYIAGYEHDGYFPGGYLIVGDDGRISAIIEKPGAGQQPSNLVTIVAHIHADASRLIEAVRAEYAKDTPTDDHYERAMAALMPDHPFQVVRYRGDWTALKYPWHVLDVMHYFLTRIKGQHVAESAFIAHTASLVGDVYIGENVKVFPGAAVVGPAYIGAGTIIGNNALVRASMVLSRCEVGFTTEIARSYVADHVSMHACRVLDSVLMSRVNFSAGCTTANLRIDRGPVPSMIKGQKVNSGRDKFGAVIGENAFVGVDVMTMPGVKIGRDAEIGPGTHVHHDIPEQVRVYVRQEVQMIQKKTGNAAP
ncbi:MAG: sugar phosphate nucleotidyltransferase [bacterium]|nr:sugar phosphate nucleotidyltransferase [bacterium]